MARQEVLDTYSEFQRERDELVETIRWVRARLTASLLLQLC
jgi:hypothetical protein